MSKSFKPIVFTTSAVAAVSAATLVDAEPLSFGGFYVGGQVANSSMPGIYEDISGTPVGVFAGYNFVASDLVFGFEVSRLNDIGGGSGYSDVHHATDFKLRVGKVFGDAMLYGSIGRSLVDSTYGGFETSDNGPLIGIGLDYNLNENAFVGVELVRRNVDIDPIGYLDDGPLQTISIRAGFRF